MNRVSAAQARQHLSDLLDAAERGEEVVIERRGVRFVLRSRKPPARARRRALVAFVDPAITAGDWTWVEGPQGLRFSPRRRAR